MTSTPSRLPWSHTTKALVVTVSIALGVYLISRFRAAIAPLILSVILAYVLAPAVDRIQARTRWPRVWAALAVYLLLLAILAILPAALIPLMADQFQALDLDLQRLAQAVAGWPEKAWTIGGRPVIPAPVFTQLRDAWHTLAESFLQRSFSLLLQVLSSAAWGVLVLVVSFYLVKDGQRVRSWLEGLVPPAGRDDYRRLRDEINLVWSAFFRGQVVLALIVALLFTLVGWAIGLPLPLALGLLAGLLEFLPTIGHGLWFVVGVTVALLQGSTWIPIPSWAFALLVAGLHVVFQQVDLNLLIPRVIGRRVHLPPVVVILGIVAGAAVGGVLGVALAAPTIASARILGRYVYANLLDMDPFARPDDTPMIEAAPSTSDT